MEFSIVQHHKCNVETVPTSLSDGWQNLPQPCPTLEASAPEGNTRRFPKSWGYPNVIIPIIGDDPWETNYEGQMDILVLLSQVDSLPKRGHTRRPTRPVLRQPDFPCCYLRTAGRFQLHRNKAARVQQRTIRPAWGTWRRSLRKNLM